MTSSSSLRFYEGKRPKAEKITDEQWKPHLETVEALRRDGKSQVQIREHLESEEGFVVTRGQLQRLLSSRRGNDAEDAARDRPAGLHAEVPEERQAVPAVDPVVTASLEKSSAARGIDERNSQSETVEVVYYQFGPDIKKSRTVVSDSNPPLTFFFSTNTTKTPERRLSQPDDAVKVIHRLSSNGTVAKAITVLTSKEPDFGAASRGMSYHDKIMVNDSLDRAIFVRRLANELHQRPHEGCTQSILRFCKILLQLHPELEVGRPSANGTFESFRSACSFLFLTGGFDKPIFSSCSPWHFTRDEITALSEPLGEWCWAHFRTTPRLFWDAVALLVCTAAVVTSTRLPLRVASLRGINVLLDTGRTLDLIDEAVRFNQDQQHTLQTVVTVLENSIRRLTRNAQPRPQRLQSWYKDRHRRPAAELIGDFSGSLNSIPCDGSCPEHRLSESMLPCRHSTSTTSSVWSRFRLTGQGNRLSWSSLGSGDIPSRMMRRNSSRSSITSDLRQFFRDSLSSFGGLSDTEMDDSMGAMDNIVEEDANVKEEANEEDEERRGPEIPTKGALLIESDMENPQLEDDPMEVDG